LRCSRPGSGERGTWLVRFPIRDAAGDENGLVSRDDGDRDPRYAGGDEAFSLGFDVGNRRRVELVNHGRLILAVTAASAERSRREQETDGRDWSGAQGDLDFALAQQIDACV
jgi:hypothetical protein